MEELQLAEAHLASTTSYTYYQVQLAPGLPVSSATSCGRYGLQLVQALQAASSTTFELRALPAADCVSFSGCIFGPARFGPKEIVIVTSATAARCAAATRRIRYRPRVLLIAASGGAASCVFDQLRAAGATGLR